MWRILSFVSLFSLWTITTGQQGPKSPPPQITDFLKYDLVNPGQVKGFFVLPCSATGKNLKWTWKFNDKMMEDGELQSQYSRRRLQKNGTLIVTNLGNADSGTYQCFVEDTVSKVLTFSRKIIVKVTVIKNFVNTNPKEEEISLGDPLSVECPPHDEGYGVSYSWEGVKDKVQFERNERRAISPSGHLFIMYVTRDDITSLNSSGGILCKMSAINKYYESGPLTLKQKGTGSTPDRPAQWEVEPEQVEVAIEGRTKELYCLAGGKPAPKIIWKKNGVQLKSAGAIELPIAFYNRLLNITNVQKGLHEDKYTCEAEVNGRVNLQHDFSLEVEVSPRWTTDAPKSEIFIGIEKNGTIVCDVTADPLPSFSWYRNGREIQTPSPSDSKVRVEGNKLHFTKVTLNEDGIYQCVANNSHGMIVSSTWVHVLTKAPSFKKKGFGPFYLFEESVGRLKCNPEAAPRPTFKWYKGGKELNTAPYSVQVDGTLIINNVNRARDAGEFSCFATNFVGNDTAKADATIYEKTRITVPPKSRKVNTGSRIDLRCEARADPELQLRYSWKKDGADLVYDDKIEWRPSQNVLTISDMTAYDAAIYTCVAYTPEPKRSEDQASATVSIKGVPEPPTNLALAENCTRKTTLTWVPGTSNEAPITHFLIEQKAVFPDNKNDVFRFVATVPNPNVTSFDLFLPGGVELYFRMRAVNRFGPSRASLPTTTLCRSLRGVPDKWPDNLRGVATKAEMLDIRWTPMPRIEWNAPGLYYKLWYKRARDSKMTQVNITDPTQGNFSVKDPGYYELWQFQIQALNDEGPGKKSPLVFAYSGQDPPDGKPEDFTVVSVTARSVELSWTPVTVARGSVDGYRIYYWGESRINAKRRRRDIPSYAFFTNVTGGNTRTHTVTNLTPYTDYNLVIKAFNNGGEGPASTEVRAETEEAEPGPPSEVNVYAFAKYILVTWQQPQEPNGIITSYRVGSAMYYGSQPNVDVEMEPVGPATRRKLLVEQTPKSNYVVEIQAQTSKGWGESVRKTTRTVQWSAPAKPNKPTVEGTAVDEVRVTYNFGLGGGYTHEFLVMYRKKVDGESFQNTSWVNYFDTDSVDIGNLSPELYEFKTVARNDYPNIDKREESPASDVVEGRPLPGVVNAGKRVTKPIQETAWFITLMVLIAVILIVLLMMVLWSRHRGTKYLVGKREKERAALVDRDSLDELEGAPISEGRTENPPPYQSDGSLQRDRDSDRDSLDDYGEGPQFNEDGSFIGEYGDDDKVVPDVKASEVKHSSAVGTFV